MIFGLQLLVSAAVLLGFAYILWKPQWAILPIVLMFPLEQLLQVYIPLLRNYQSLINYAVGFLALFALLSRFFRREPVTTGYINRGTYALFGLYALCWIGLLWSPSRDAALEMLKFSFPYYGLMVVIAPLLVPRLDDFRPVLTGIMFVGGIIALLILINPEASYYAGRLTLDVSQYAGQRGGRGNPLALAEMGGTMALVAMLIRSDRSRVWLTVLRLAAFTLGMALAIGSGSRGQVLAALAIGVVFFPVARKVANPQQFLTTALGLGVIGIGVVAVFRYFVGEQNQARWDPTLLVDNLSERFARISELLTAWISNPLAWVFGLGTNAYSSIRTDSNYVHNMMAEALGEFGILGFCILIALLWATYRSCRGLWQDAREEPDRRATAAIVGALSFYAFLLAQKQGSFVGSPFAFLYWVIACRIAFFEQSQPQAVAAEPAPEDWADQTAEEAEWDSEWDSEWSAATG